MAPTTQQVTSKLNTGFSSDHYHVKAKIRVKLGAQIEFLPRKPKLEYTADPETAIVFNQAFRQSIKSQREISLWVHRPQVLQTTRHCPSKKDPYIYIYIYILIEVDQVVKVNVLLLHQKGSDM